MFVFRKKMLILEKSGEIESHMIKTTIFWKKKTIGDLNIRIVDQIKKKDTILMIFIMTMIIISILLRLLNRCINSSKEIHKNSHGKCKENK